MDKATYFLVRDPSIQGHAARAENITTPSGFEILWDPARKGYILPGFGKKRFAKEIATDFAKKLESKYGKDNTAQT